MSHPKITSSLPSVRILCVHTNPLQRFHIGQSYALSFLESDHRRTLSNACNFICRCRMTVYEVSKCLGLQYAFMDYWLFSKCKDTFCAYCIPLKSDYFWIQLILPISFWISTSSGPIFSIHRPLPCLQHSTCTIGWEHSSMHSTHKNGEKWTWFSPLSF